MTTTDVMDELEIRYLLDRWALYRDTGDWDRLKALWHPDGRMSATRFQGSADDFVEMCAEGFRRGRRSWHTLAGTAVDVVGTRAVAQTKMTITTRAVVHTIDVDVSCTGRFYDFLEKRDGTWGLVLRQPIYERDRMDPVDPTDYARLELDASRLEKFPQGYRHLAYVQTLGGSEVDPNLPTSEPESVEALYRKGRDWLSGVADPSSL